MFHGPAYQGVVELGPLGDEGIDGVLVAGEAPGMLLDNAGQLMGYWVMVGHERDRLALPTAIERIDLFGPPPAPGTALACAVRVRALDGGSVRADLELGTAGRLWARIEGWEDRRFESDEVVWPVLMWPELSLLAQPAPGGWMVAEEHWRSSASRELMMRRYLGAAEQADYEGHNPRAQRLFLLGRIAAKDAVRQWLWDHGAGPCWPVEVALSNDENGRPRVVVPGHPGLSVSIAHTPWMAVALVRDGADVGIDVERIEPRAAGFVASAFGPDEEALLLDGTGPEARDEWLTRGWAAKEAAAKAAGTGLGGRPRSFVVTGRRGATMVVDGRAVETARRGDVVVAWTTEGAEGP